MISQFPAHDLHEHALQDLRDKWDQEAREHIARNPIYTEEPLPSSYKRQEFPS